MGEIVEVDFIKWLYLEESWQKSGGEIESEHGLWLLVKDNQTCFKVLVTHKRPPLSTKEAKLKMQDLLFEMIIDINSYPES